MKETYYDENKWVTTYGKKTVCYGCEKREAGCHAKCEEYKEEQEYNRKEREALKNPGAYTQMMGKKEHSRKKPYMRRY